MVARFIGTHTRSALDALTIERERTATERDAFAAFHDRIDAMEVSGADTGHDRRVGIHSTHDTQPNEQLQCVRESYEELVMNLPHYDDEYHESLTESLANEFCPAVAEALTTSTQFTAPLRSQLLTESQEAKIERTDFLKLLSRESESLQSADETIATIGTDLDTLTAHSLETWERADLTENHERVRAVVADCEAVAKARQATLETLCVPGPAHADIDLNEYLYQSLSVSYPVLADIADIAETLSREQARIEDALGWTNNAHSTHPLSP
ncbi:MAG TPA: hypothetical protein VFJ06_02295 [Halococcus sp.]|nr:hypothetical protein [Halococcus sp.]